MVVDMTDGITRAMPDTSSVTLLFIYLYLKIKSILMMTRYNSAEIGENLTLFLKS